MKKKISLLLSIALLFAMSISVNAANIIPRAESLYDCSLSIGNSSDGITLSFVTRFTTEADEIGCTDIILYEKVNGSWKKISIPGGSTTNSSLYASGGTYTGAVKGRSYKASCTHYAIYNGVKQTVNTSTRELVYN